MKNQIAPKDLLFVTAARLFFRFGYRATGVDTIAAEAGIGKMTLYRHYPSKNDLIVAYLQDSDRGFWEHFERSTEAASTPHEKLTAFFVSLQDYVTSPACYGCPFLNVVAEYPESEHPGHQVALSHKEAVRVQFRELAQAAGAIEPEALADALLLLMDGAYLAARMYGSSPGNPAANVAQTAQLLIEAHLRA